MRGQALAQRTFWWDRTRPVDADVDPLRAVIFDVDAVADVDGDGDLAPRSGLIDLVMSLFVAGIWVGVVSTGRRSEVEPLVRELIGDGLVETIVTADDVTGSDPQIDVYELALWELGIEPECGLAMVGSDAGFRAASRVGLPAIALSGNDTGCDDFTAALAVRSRYDGDKPLLALDCQRLHRRWRTGHERTTAA